MLLSPYQNKLKTCFEEQLSKVTSQIYGGAEKVGEASLYALTVGGKRIRPLLNILCCEATGGSKEASLRSAIALEMIHTYSLIHDDLPAMDNDDFRRGKPSTHKQYGEAIAILAGDALLSDAFWVLTNTEINLLPMQDKYLASIIGTLAKASGGTGMVLGQSLDLKWTGQGHQGDLKSLIKIHEHKTGALIAAACSLGALIGSGSTTVADIYFAFGLKLGLCFQLIDDLLDQSPSLGTTEASSLGKTPGKDLASNKLTFLSVMSRDQANTFALELKKELSSFIQINCLLNFRDEMLALLNALLERKY